MTPKKLMEPVASLSKELESVPIEDVRTGDIKRFK
jgi:hypothetical protein